MNKNEANMYSQSIHNLSPFNILSYQLKRTKIGLSLYWVPDIECVFQTRLLQREYKQTKKNVYAWQPAHTLTYCETHDTHIYTEIEFTVLLMLLNECEFKFVRRCFLCLVTNIRTHIADE